jgi:ABC-type uncharacterized transport system permease subunit
MNLMNICSTLPPSIHLAIIVLTFAWEYVMGKTNFGSTIGMVLEHPLKYIWSKIFPKAASGLK